MKRPSSSRYARRAMVARTLGCERGLKRIGASNLWRETTVARTLGCERGLKQLLRQRLPALVGCRSHPRVRAWIETKISTRATVWQSVARTLGCERGLKPNRPIFGACVQRVARTLGCERGLKLAWCHAHGYDADGRSHPRVRAWIETCSRPVPAASGSSRSHPRVRAWIETRLDVGHRPAVAVARTLGCERGLKLRCASWLTLSQWSLAPSGASVD